MHRVAKRKREEEEKCSPETAAVSSLSVDDLPRVLLAHCFSFLHGVSRQSLSLVCKRWCALEKDKLAWPNILELPKPTLELITLLTPRIQGKRFDRLIIRSEGSSAHALNINAFLRNVKVRVLSLGYVVIDQYRAVSEMTHAQSIDITRTFSLTVNHSGSPRHARCFS